MYNCKNIKILECGLGVVVGLKIGSVVVLERERISERL
jgi:hypothetical protein